MTPQPFSPAFAKHIKLTTLPNGLRIVTDTMPHVETVAVGVWANVGTRHEPAKLNGIAHLLEHMMFKGTSSRSARDISIEIENVGGHMNAYTAREQTAYYVRLVAEEMPLALSILADIIQNSTFEEAELERERTVIIQELAQVEDTPDDIVLDYFQQAAYPKQPLGLPILGNGKIVQKITRQDVQDYYQKHYAASNLLLAAAGKVDHEKFVEMVRKSFNHLAETPAKSFIPGRYVGGDRRIKKSAEQTHLVIGFSAPHCHEPDFYALQLLTGILGGGMSSRLFQEVREKRGLAYNIHSFSASYMDAGLFGVYAGTSTQNAAGTLEIICQEMLKLTQNMTEEEIERARRQLFAGMKIAQESVGARCEQIAQQILTYNQPLDPQSIKKSLLQMTKTDLEKLLGKILSTPLTFTALGGAAKNLEGYEAIQKRFR